MKTFAITLLVMSLLATASEVNSATTTKTYTLPCAGSGNSTHRITTDNETGRVLSIETTNCGGVTKTEYYSYPKELVGKISPIVGGASISISGSQFQVTSSSHVEIIMIDSASVAYTYPNTIPANTPTNIWNGLNAGTFILVAHNPNVPSTIYATDDYTKP